MVYDGLHLHALMFSLMQKITNIFGKTPTQSVPRKDNNIEISIFNVVAQKVVLASDQCEIFTTL